MRYRVIQEHLNFIRITTVVTFVSKPCRNGREGTGTHGPNRMR